MVSGYTTHRLYRSNKNTVDYNSTLCIPNAVNMTPATTGSNTKLISAGFQNNNCTQKRIIHQVQTKKKRGIKKQPLQICTFFPLLHSSAGCGSAKATLTVWLMSGKTVVSQTLTYKRFLLLREPDAPSTAVGRRVQLQYRLQLFSIIQSKWSDDLT